MDEQTEGVQFDGALYVVELAQLTPLIVTLTVSLAPSAVCSAMPYLIGMLCGNLHVWFPLPTICTVTVPVDGGFVKVIWPDAVY